jgi:aryl-alcohol dehydrogenase-like predicted oxidoreductase
MLPGQATPEGTARYAGRFAPAATGHFRPVLGRTISSIGIGTYLGRDDAATDAAYAAAVRRALQLGINVVDTAINYRNQRSERAVAVALREGSTPRDAIVVCTKGGYLPFDGSRPADVRAYVERTFLAPGLLEASDIVAGCHSLAPAFLRDQLDRSRRNLGVAAVDVYYVHNPETQLGEVSRAEFVRRMRGAFEVLERACADGIVGVYGTATWSGYRLPPDDPEHLSLHELVGVARELAGDGHHFRAVQLPFNMEMDEARAERNQRGRTLLEAAREEGIAVFASASMLQGELARRLPNGAGDTLPPLRTDAQRALHFVRSTRGIACALAGMKTTAHVEENAELARQL